MQMEGLEGLWVTAGVNQSLQFKEFIKAIITSVELEAFCLDTVTVLSHVTPPERTVLTGMFLDYCKSSWGDI